MAKRKKKGGGLFSGALVFVVILSCIFAWLKTPTPIDTNNPMEFFEAKSQSVEAWAKQIEKDGLPALLKGLDLDSLGDAKMPDPGAITKETIGGGSGGGTADGGVLDGGSGGSKDSDSGGFLDGLFGGSKDDSGTGGTKDLSTAARDGKAVLKTLKVADAQSVNYNRDDWNHWVNAPDSPSCWNVRDEVLWRDSDKGALVLLDSGKKVTKDKSKACYVQSGKWVDPYSGKTFTDPKQIDIDHMIPLSYAAQHGGQDWSAKKKEDYANNLSNSRHLLATSATENRSKGDKGPSEYQPKTNHCQYAVDWIDISSKWNLTLTKSDKKSLEDMLAKC